MQVVNPLFRNQGDSMTAAHKCTCICNIDTPNQHDNTGDKAWWWGVPDCGCGCNPDISRNETSNSTKANENS
ncbi:hypothetical protein [Paenibacillus macerans]|uniref:hypothetical protein n=1 Tax=Paenibacillus macerans TaxID=44252 RepID=UPI002041502C|nr:hypothetical protein [Paenibacillus macerans]MCM3702177.1 hypothetical protein [Paenibacillus macerans]